MAKLARITALFALLASAASAQTMPIVVYPSQSAGQAMASRSRSGVYRLEAAVNGTPLPMMFDTGASFVALRAEDAARAGIDVGNLNYAITLNTANGATEVAPVTLSSLTVGGITRRNVRAVVGRPGRLSDNLLGQTFLSRLAGYRMDGDHIVLQGD